MTVTRQKAKLILDLFRGGWDTVSIAAVTRMSEADIYNILARRAA